MRCFIGLIVVCCREIGVIAYILVSISCKSFQFFQSLSSLLYINDCTALKYSFSHIIA